MEQPTHILENGTRVRTTHQLNEQALDFLLLQGNAGILVKRQHLDARKPNLPGTIHGVVPGHGDDVYWVLHRDNTIGAYMFTEFELDPSPGRPTRMEILRK